MSLILLLMINFKGSVGFTWGYYAPSLDSLNRWLHGRHERMLRTTSMVIGGAGRIEFLKFLMVEASVDYYKGRSPDNARSLMLIPAEAYLTYKYVIFPVYLHSYTGVGVGLCFTEYKDKKYDGRFEQSGWGIGPVVKTGLEFIPTPRFAFELSAGWRFIEVTDIDELKDPETGTQIPIRLWGGYIRLSLERLLK